jgi:hypothetical protein
MRSTFSAKLVCLNSTESLQVHRTFLFLHKPVLFYLMGIYITICLPIWLLSLRQLLPSTLSLLYP